MKVYRWTSDTQKKEYSIGIPIFDDDTIGTVITKIALDIQAQEPAQTVDVSVLPYVWADKHPHALAFEIKGAHSELNPFILVSKASSLPVIPNRYKVTQFTDDMWRKHKTLNITFANDVPPSIRSHPLFFPLKLKVSETHKRVVKEANIIKTVWDIGEQRFKEAKPELMFRRITFVGEVGNVDMSYMLDKLRTKGKQVPFNQFILDSTKILYKVSKRHGLSASLVEQLVAYDRVPKIQGIVAIIPMSKHDADRHVYARVVMDVTGKVSIHYKIDHKVKLTWKNILDHNTFVKQWLGMKVTLKVLSLSARTLIMTTRTLSIRDFEGKASQLHNIFHIDKPASNGAIEMIYKRSANYKSNLDIVDNIKSQIQVGIPETEVAENLVRNTGMSQEEAKEWIEQYHAIVENEAMNATGAKPADKKRKYIKSSGCSIKVKAEKLGFKVNFENLGSLYELRYASIWVGGIMHVAADAAPTKKKNAPIVPPPKSISTSTDTSNSDSSSNRNKGNLLNVHVNRYQTSDDSSDGGAVGKENVGYFVGRLERSDPDVFKIDRKDNKGNKMSYSRLCGVTNFRQPVVVDDKKMMSIREQGYGNAIDDSVRYRNNNYFCPRIWCPKAEIPVTNNQLVDRDGKKVCPGEFGEEPMILYADNFWNKDPARPHHIGFLDKQKSDSGLCLPCCMKKPLINSNKPAAKIMLADCLANKHNNPTNRSSSSRPQPTHPDPVPGKPPAPSIGSIGSISNPVQITPGRADDTNFILSAPAPIPVGRYGVLPRDVYHMLSDNVSYESCSSTLSSNPCFVRLGIDHGNYGNDSLLNAIAVCLQLPVAELVSFIKKGLDPLTFMSIDNGNLMSAHMGTSDSVVTKGLIAESKMWIARHPHCESLIDTTNENSIARQALIYNAYLNFIDSLNSEDEKYVPHIIDIMGSLGVTLIVFDNAEAYCPARVITNPDVVIMVLQSDKYFEPIVSKTRSKQAIGVFVASDVAHLLSLLNSTCDQSYVNAIAQLRGIHQWIDVMLIAKAYMSIAHVLLRPDLRIHGFLTVANLMIVAPGGLPCSLLPSILKVFDIKSVRFMEDLDGTQLEVKNIPTNDLFALNKKLSTYGMRIDTSFTNSQDLKTPLVHGMYNIPSMLDVALPTIRLPSSPSLVYGTLATRNKEKQWFQLKDAVSKLIVEHYDTLIVPLIPSIKKTGSRKFMLDTLLRTFATLPHKQEVYAILQQMPLSEGKEAILRWRRVGSTIELDARWMSKVIHDNKTEWIFTQVAVAMGGLPDYILNPRSGPVLDVRFSKDLREVVLPAKPPTIVATPTFLDDSKKSQLPSKWRRGSFTECKILEGADYNIDSFKQFVSWLSNKIMVPVQYVDIDLARRKDMLNRMMNPSEQSNLLADPSIAVNMFAKLITGKLMKNEKELLAAFNKPDLNAMQRKRMLSDFFLGHGHHIWPGDIDLNIMSRLMDISILNIHSRLEYRKGKDNAKRGNDNDRLVSSSFMRGSAKWESRPIIILFKMATATALHNTYRPVVLKNGTFVNESLQKLPVDIQNFLAAHVAAATI